MSITFSESVQMFITLNINEAFCEKKSCNAYCPIFHEPKKMPRKPFSGRVENEKEQWGDWPTAEL